MRNIDNFNENTIRKTAELARLELTDEEIKQFTLQLKEVFKYFSELNKINTKGINPTFQVTNIKNKLREDIVRPGLKREEALSRTSHQNKKYFEIKRVINKLNPI